MRFMDRWPSLSALRDRTEGALEVETDVALEFALEFAVEDLIEGGVAASFSLYWASSASTNFPPSAPSKSQICLCYTCDVSANVGIICDSYSRVGHTSGL